MMTIHELTKEECQRLLAGARLVRLASAQGNQPYVVPTYLAYDETSGCLYGFTTPGQKVEWMRANPLVCVEVDEIVADDEWASVIGMGRYEELPATPGVSGQHQQGPRDDSRYHRSDEECHDEQERAWQLLKTARPTWWEPGSTAWASRADRDPGEPITFIYFRIRLGQLTGHKATPDAGEAISHVEPSAPLGTWSRLRGTLMRVFGS